MMYEIDAARQPEIPSTTRGFRRLFADAEYTLHVWYDRREGRITEFHIFYGPTRARRLSWSLRSHRLADGEVTERGFWGSDGIAPGARFDAAAFSHSAASIDAAVRDFVTERLARRLADGQDALPN